MTAVAWQAPERHSKPLPHAPQVCAPVPHSRLVWVEVTHWSPAQQPVGHVAGVHAAETTVHSPEWHSLPLGHVFEVGAYTQTPSAVHWPAAANVRAVARSTQSAAGGRLQTVPVHGSFLQAPFAQPSAQLESALA